MTAKEKAEELKKKFAFMYHDNGSAFVLGGNIGYIAKKGAIISVNEIIEAIKTTTGHCTLSSLDYHECMDDIKYWKEVIKEIDKL